jgi:hypothetical protein
VTPAGRRLRRLVLLALLGTLSSCGSGGPGGATAAPSPTVSPTPTPAPTLAPVPAPAVGFGGGTISYPTGTDEGPFGAVAVSPGYTGVQRSGRCRSSPPSTR